MPAARPRPLGVLLPVLAEMGEQLRLVDTAFRAGTWSHFLWVCPESPTEPGLGVRKLTGTTAPNADGLEPRPLFPRHPASSHSLASLLGCAISALGRRTAPGGQLGHACCCPINVGPGGEWRTRRLQSMAGLPLWREEALSSMVWGSADQWAQAWRVRGPVVNTPHLWSVGGRSALLSIFTAPPALHAALCPQGPWISYLSPGIL